MRRVLAAVLVAVALTACQDPPSSGTVTDKHYEPESSYMTMQCFSYNTNGTCAMNMPVWHTVPPEWMLKVQSDTDPDHVGWVSVDPGTFDRYQVGWHYPERQ